MVGSPRTRQVLVAYDGSPGAKSAVDEAARLFPGADALIVTVWESVGDAARLARAALSDEVISGAVEKLDAAAREAATQLAAAGTERAGAADLEAEALVERAEPSIAGTLLRIADEREASALVLSSRRLSGLRAALLGSVSNAVVHRCRCPVVVVPPPDEPESP